MEESTQTLFDRRGPCPACGASWQDKPIPEEYRQKGYYGPPETAPTHYTRLIGIEIRGGYDGVSYWRCPDCGQLWDRFTGERVDEIPSGKS